MPTQQPQTDLLEITDLPKNVNVPFWIAVIAFSTFLFCVFSGFIFSFIGIGITFFALAFIFSLVGLIVSVKYKKSSTGYSSAQLKRLQVSKSLSLLILILTSLVILGVVSLLILIGNGGFGR